MNIRPQILLTFFLSALNLYQCSNSVSDGGGGSETTNSITVCIKENKVSGKIACDAQIHLIDTNFNPVYESLNISTIADSEGKFEFNLIKPGCYNLYSKYDSAEIFERVILIQHIPVNHEIDTVIYRNYETPFVINCKFMTDGPQQDSTPEIPGLFIFFKGTPFKSESDDNGMFISGIPPGVYECDFMSISDDPIEADNRFEIDDSISVPDTKYDTLDSLELIIHIKQ